MVERKYTLPRHTNLAPQGRRSGAFLIDAALSILLTLAFFFLAFEPIFRSKTSEATNALNDERYKSQLFFKNEKGELDSYDSSSSFEEFRDSLYYFYTVYIPEISPDKDDMMELSGGTKVSKSEYYTSQWVSENIFKVNEKDSFFEYQVVEGQTDKTKPVIMKETSQDIEVNIFLQHVSDEAINDCFNLLPTIKKMINNEQFLYQLIFICSVTPSLLIVYVLMPFILKQGVTVGKKVFGLGLATIDGYKMKDHQILLRFIPMAVLIAALFIPIWNNLFIVLIVFLTIFLSSFAVSMASPKKTAIHDLCARTIVVDIKSSIIFQNEFEEEDYIAKEDNLPLDDVYRGEEPDISYEK